MDRPRADAQPNADPARRRRLRADAARGLDVNLAETIALSHKLLKIANTASIRRKLA